MCVCIHTHTTYLFIHKQSTTKEERGKRERERRGAAKKNGQSLPQPEGQYNRIKDDECRAGHDLMVDVPPFFIMPLNTIMPP